MAKIKHEIEMRRTVYFYIGRLCCMAGLKNWFFKTFKGKTVAYIGKTKMVVKDLEK